MRCPSFDELPPASPGKSGWLWTLASPQLPDVMPNGRPWPRVSIVTPSYNQARFIEETLRSVLLQGYPNLEYIVIDGGSTDSSVEIIRKYAAWLAYWVSEPDRGQSHAVNKGWKRATGDILAYLNSDDFYLPGALNRAVMAFEEYSSAVVYCDGLWTDEFGRKVKILKGGQLDAKQLIMGSTVDIPQPTAFIRKEAIQSVGGLDESLHMAMDFDLWLRLALRYPLKYIEGEPWAAFRSHSTQKTQRRILEDRTDALRAIERAILDPRCPEGTTLEGNSLYARLCLDLAAIYFQEQGDLNRSGKYLTRALQAQPMTTLSLAVYRALVRTYRAILPRSLQGWVRRMRGIELPS